MPHPDACKTHKCAKCTFFGGFLCQITNIITYATDKCAHKELAAVQVMIFVIILFGTELD